jgi:mannitol-1-/sugar-/sorbitol-6-phosphatase
VLFDLDGVLVDSTPAVELVWQAFARRHGLDRSVLDGLHGRRMVDILADLLPGCDPAVLDAEGVWVEELEVAGAVDTLSIAGAADLTASLHDRPWAIVTSCTAAVAGARLDSGGVVRPPLLVTAEQVTRGKPSPEPYLTAAELLGVDPSRCVVIEDAPAGLAAARAAGATTIGVATSHTRQELVGADHLVASVASVRRPPRLAAEAGIILQVHDLLR